MTGCWLSWYPVMHWGTEFLSLPPYSPSYRENCSSVYCKCGGYTSEHFLQPGLLNEVQIVRQAMVRKILKQAKRCWLSLRQCVHRLIEQQEALGKFFKKEANHEPATQPPSSKTSATLQKNAFSDPKSACSDTSFDMPKYLVSQQQLADKKKESVTSGSCDKPFTKPQFIYHFLADPLSSVYAQLPQHGAPLFDKANLLLQKDESCIHVLHATMEMQPQKSLYSLWSLVLSYP